MLSQKKLTLIDTASPLEIINEESDKDLGKLPYKR